MTYLRNWQLSMSESGTLGILGYTQNHPRYPDGTRITYTSKFDELGVLEDRFVFSTKTVSYIVLFADYAGVCEFSFMHELQAQDVYEVLSKSDADLSAKLYRIASERSVLLESN